MRRQHTTWLMATFLLLGGVMPASAWGQACMDILKRTLAQSMDPASQPQEGRYCLMECELVSAPRDSQEVAITRQQIKMVIGARQLAYESPQMTVYSDAEMTATIVKSNKVVMLSESFLKNQRKAPLPTAELLNSNMLAGAQIGRCEAVKLPSGKKGRLIELLPGTGKLGDRSISAIRYWIDESTLRIEAVRVNYTLTAPLAYTYIQYKRVDYDHAGPALPTSVRGMVLSPGGTLNKSYTGYQLIQTQQQP